MSVFTEAEIAYLQGQTMGRLATIGRDGQPHITPVTYAYNAAEDTIDIGGIDFANTKKWRDAKQNSHVTFLIDDFSPTSAHALEVRGEAETHETGGASINPRFPQFVEQFIRLRPKRIVSWGLEPDTGMTAQGFKAYARDVD
jgi:pyridoxamine 5'-phosphate oxidase family protein